MDTLHSNNRLKVERYGTIVMLQNTKFKDKKKQK